MSTANEPDPVSTANEPDPVSTANEPTIRMEVVRGGDPGDAVLAAVATILTRPVVVAAEAAADDDEPTATTARWRRAARLEAIVHGRRIMSIAELVRHR